MLRRSALLHLGASRSLQQSPARGIDGAGSESVWCARCAAPGSAPCLFVCILACVLACVHVYAGACVRMRART